MINLKLVEKFFYVEENPWQTLNKNITWLASYDINYYLYHMAKFRFFLYLKSMTMD